MKQNIILLLLCSCLFLIKACDGNNEQKIELSDSGETKKVEENIFINEDEVNSEEQIDFSLFDGEPTEWGENVTGVKTNFQTTEKELALTFDACGGPLGSEFDEELISFLKKEEVPATLFINEGWIEANEDLFLQLANEPLFQIENHGTEHVPLSINGGEVYGIAATDSAESAYEEIMSNHATVKALTNKEMTLFRSGTAYYDEVAVELAVSLGYEVVNFDILGDAGASYSPTQVKDALLEAKPGSIALLHMNQPNSGTAEGVKQAVPLLRDQGFEFVLLKDKQFK